MAGKGNPSRLTNYTLESANQRVGRKKKSPAEHKAGRTLRENLCRGLDYLELRLLLYWVLNNDQF